MKQPNLKTEEGPAVTKQICSNCKAAKAISKFGYSVLCAKCFDLRFIETAYLVKRVR